MDYKSRWRSTTGLTKLLPRGDLPPSSTFSYTGTVQYRPSTVPKEKGYVVVYRDLPLGSGWPGWPGEFYLSVSVALQRQAINSGL